MSNIILFSNGCPRCKVLKQKLDDKQIKYTINEDFEELIENGLQTAPVLKVDDNYYQFGEAVRFVGRWDEN